MNNAIFKFGQPKNEDVKAFVPGSSDRRKLMEELESCASEVKEIPLVIAGKEVYTGKTVDLVMPHNHRHLLAKVHQAGPAEVKMAIKAANKAHAEWESFSWVERLSITQKAAELLLQKYRYKMNAYTMLGQSKNIFQSEIDAVCETIDFLRFNGYYMSEIYNEQPLSEPAIINRKEYRPLEGFVFALTPFNFTSIASNLNMAPVLMGNTTLWKPSATGVLSNYLLMQIFMEAGLPGGVINFIPGDGAEMGKQIFSSYDFAGIHFTGSTSTFNAIWKNIAENIGGHKSYPRLVGETGGKDFVFVHASAGIDEVATALVRGAFEYQGQKCSAASRAYIPESLWKGIRAKMEEMISQITVGNVTEFTNFMNAVIDQKAYKRIMNYIEFAEKAADAEVIIGGKGNDSVGYFIDPTVILTSDPHFKTMEEEIFGPVLTVYVYKDKDFEKTLELCDTTSPYGLTGAIFASDRKAINQACRVLKYAAGNLYFNDKPTGAVVGQQPFGGARGSGTNDKAGSHLNLLRWTNPRTIKETLVPPVDFKYPFMKEDKCH